MQDKRSGSKEQIEALLEHVEKQPVKAYNKFREALINTDQEDVVKNYLPAISKLID